MTQAFQKVLGLHGTCYCRIQSFDSLWDSCLSVDPRRERDAGVPGTLARVYVLFCFSGRLRFLAPKSHGQNGLWTLGVQRKLETTETHTMLVTDSGMVQLELPWGKRDGV